MSEHEVETVGWTERPAEPSNIAKILQKMRLRRIAHRQSITREIPVSDIDLLEDPRLREALHQKRMLSPDSRFAVMVIANSDGTYATSVQVPRGPLALWREREDHGAERTNEE